MIIFEGNRVINCKLSNTNIKFTIQNDIFIETKTLIYEHKATNKR